jgi:hypothetical protein
MLRNYIEGRERRWHQRDSNRFPRPFEWGIEHLNLKNGTDPRAALETFAAEAVQGSERFYAYSPTEDYQFDGYTLQFPSSVETPHLVNNTVRGRFFPAAGPLAVIVLPQWNAQRGSHIGLCRILQRFGISALRLSLPYHDDRRPLELERAEPLVGPNVGQTIATTRQAVLDVRRAADWLANRGYTRLGVLGTSIGSCIGFLAMAHDARLQYNAFIHVSSYFADVVWEGLSTSHVRESLESTIRLEELRRFWAPISPYPFIQRLSDSQTPMLVLSGRYDLSFPFHLTRQSFEEFDRHRVPYERVLLPCGHYTMALSPFREIVGFQIVKFFRRYREG